jgi:microcystin-dependent protein
MAKTSFTNNVSKIYAAVLNTIYGTGANGGHRHDGADDDGHCGKINLTNGTDITGTLPPVMCGAVPIGVILPWATALMTAPNGFLFCDGSTFSAVTYPALNTLLGGNTLPDLRGKFIIGASGTYPAGTIGGEATHELALAEMPSHGHALCGSNPTNDPIAFDAYGTAGSSVPTAPGKLNSTSVESQSCYVTLTGGDGEGDTTPHNNLPPYAALQWIIKAV